MFNYFAQLGRRLLHGIGVVWGVITIVFLMRFLSPNNPAVMVAPEGASTDLIRSIEEDMGLDQPYTLQYIDYLTDIAQGDLGYSYASGLSVSGKIITGLPATLELAVTSLIFAVVLSIPLGILSAIYRGSKLDYSSNLFSLVGLSTPNFWLGIMLVLLVSVQLGLLPTSGRPNSIIQDPVGWLSHMILPTIALGTYFVALLYRMTRNSVLETSNSEYVKAAKGKGLFGPIIMYRYILQNSMSPVITVGGLQLGVLIGGSVVVEAVFAWPGIGTMFINALYAADWQTMQGILILVGVSYVLINLIVDIIIARLNPQVNLA